MKPTLSILIPPLLLWLCLSCQKPVEPVSAKSPTDCRIIAAIYKTPIEGRESGPKYDLETVVLSDGRATTVSKVLSTFYKYDGEGRIIQQDEKWPNGDYRVVRYRYESNLLFINDELHARQIPNQLRITNDTIPLYKNGLQARLRGTGVGSPYLRYNDSGQFIASNFSRPTDSCRYENSNCVEKLESIWWRLRNGKWIPTDYLMIKYQYDQSHLNIQPFLQFEGVPSRHLPLTEHWESKASTDYPDGLVYQKAYLYSFDQYGRVTRRIAHGKSLYYGWATDDDYYGVGVTDYIYECP